MSRARNVSGMKSGERARGKALCQVRTSIWSPRRQLPTRELCQLLLYSHKMPCSAHRLLVIRRTCRGGRDTTPARTAQHSTIYRVSRDNVQSTSRIPLSGRRWRHWLARWTHFTFATQQLSPPPPLATRLRVQSLPTTLHCTALTYHHITASASLSTTVCDRVIPHNHHRVSGCPADNFKLL